MRKITVLSFITLDGVMQAPGGMQEDPSNDFKFGGWITPYGDEVSAKIIRKLMAPADLMLGRKTFNIWESYWPKNADRWPGVNEVTKYVFSHTVIKSDWENCVFITNIEDVKKIKNSKGSEIKIWGSSELVKLLLQNDLVDEFWLMIHPVVLGEGKRLFDNSSTPLAFKLIENHITSTGLIITNYRKVGKVKTGSIAD
ncbi:dihydrofolate reductase family protein [Mucilaginibacter phyllosphaerae]